MVEIRQAEDDLPNDVLLGPIRHTRGLLCRRTCPIFMRLLQQPRRMGWTTAQAILHTPRRRRGDFQVADNQK